jgi:RimJ/RimL family protein N-acetyltransferase/8-oxo-dGTP pyrophosphatase MutT (NUDIX family)
VTAAGDDGSESPAQPTLTDGPVTLRPWRDQDVAEAIAGHDEEIAFWFGFEAVSPSREAMSRAIREWRAAYTEDRRMVAFAIEHAAALAGSCEVRRGAAGTGELSWALYAGHRGQGIATRAVRMLADYALTETGQHGLGMDRVEAKVEPENTRSLRVATRAGLRREGVRRVTPGTGDRAETSEYVVLARLAADPPVTDPQSFRALLNSFLPRKRAIAQLLIRDPEARVLLCQLTYKQDWDLPGGVVEVGESPQLAVGREVAEELGLDITPGELLLTDWLPPWSGWDDAVCLVFDGGVHLPGLLTQVVPQAREIRAAHWCTSEEIAAHTADFTARRILAATARPHRGTAYTESGLSGLHSDRARLL